MAERAQAIENRAAAKAKAAVQELLREYHPRDFAVGSGQRQKPAGLC